MLNWLFDGDFHSYGYDVLAYYKFGYSPKTGPINPMTVLFPKMTKCRFFSYGPTANIEAHDALCLLPLVRSFTERFSLFLLTKPYTDYLLNSNFFQNVINDKVS